MIYPPPRARSRVKYLAHRDKRNVESCSCGPYGYFERQKHVDLSGIRDMVVCQHNRQFIGAGVFVRKVTTFWGVVEGWRGVVHAK